MNIRKASKRVEGVSFFYVMDIMARVKAKALE